MELKENKEMMLAYRLLKNTDTSFFLTGRAGTGKTTFMKMALNEIDKNFIVLAPTGVAAINAGGDTIHSFFFFEPKVLTPYDKAQLNMEQRNIICSADTIIIDEVSMVRCDIIDAIDRTLQMCMKNTLPFGGKQMVFVGDMFQLEPVVVSDDREELKRLYGNRKPFFFNADVFSRIKINPIELQKVYRQTDPKFISLLDNIRIENVSHADLQILNSRVGKVCDKDKVAITLTSNNKTAHKINKTMLEQMLEPEFVFEGVVEGDFNVEKYSVTERELHLRVGAQVMFTRNHSSKRWVNGTLGKVVKIENDNIYVELNNGITCLVERVTWEKVKYTYNKITKTNEKQVVGTFTQFPLKLAWAITIHKSQGLTFDHVNIDLSGGVFAAGQTYVALSRATSLDSIYLRKPVLTSHVKTHRDVFDFASSFNSPDLEEEIKIGEEIRKHLRNYYYDAVAVALFSHGIDAAVHNDSRTASMFFTRALDCVVCDDCLFETMAEYANNRRVDANSANNDKELFVSAVLSLYGKRNYKATLQMCDKYIQLFGTTESILYIKFRACALTGDLQLANQIHDEIKCKFDNGTNLKMLYRGAILNEEYLHADGLSDLAHVLEYAPHVTTAHSIIRKLMQKRDMVLTTTEEIENEIYLIFNDREVDDDVFMETLQAHYSGNDDVYSEYLKILTQQILS